MCARSGRLFYALAALVLFPHSSFAKIYNFGSPFALGFRVGLSANPASDFAAEVKPLLV